MQAGATRVPRHQAAPLAIGGSPLRDRPARRVDVILKLSGLRRPPEDHGGSPEWRRLERRGGRPLSTREAREIGAISRASWSHWLYASETNVSAERRRLPAPRARRHERRSPPEQSATEYEVWHELGHFLQWRSSAGRSAAASYRTARLRSLRTVVFDFLEDPLDATMASSSRRRTRALDLDIRNEGRSPIPRGSKCSRRPRHESFDLRR